MATAALAATYNASRTAGQRTGMANTKATRELGRRERLLDAKTRTIGVSTRWPVLLRRMLVVSHAVYCHQIDKSALDSAVDDHKAQAAAAAEAEKEYGTTTSSSSMRSCTLG